MPQVDAFSKEVLAGNQEKRVLVVDSLVGNPATFFPLNTVVYDRATRAFYMVASDGYMPIMGGIYQAQSTGALPNIAEDGMLAFVINEEAFYKYDSLGATWDLHLKAAAQADSTAADVGTLVGDFNGLLAKLRAAGLLST